jgi:hypothetical protein
MKLLKTLSAISCIAAMMALMPSCNSSDKKTDSTTTDSTTMKHDSTTTATPAKPDNLLVVIHKVKDYDKWLPVFESDDSSQKANGLTRTVIGRGIDDPSMVLVGFKMADYDKAKAMAGSPDLKAKMEKGGVTGPPTMHFENTQVNDTNTNSMLDRIIIFSKVKDYAAWKKSFDEHSDVRKNGGVTDRIVSYDFDDNHNVTVVLAINDMTKARNFIKSPELKARMDSAGVIGKPDIFFYHVVKKY